MAKEQAQKQKIQDMKNSGFGKYDEANGGGTPVGGKFGGPSGRVGWKQRGEPGHREDQPRTKDGKFTYNSVNGKGLSETSDPDRGFTVNPLLTEGENGIAIRDVEKQFENESGAYWDKYKDKWYRKGGKYILSDLKTHVAEHAIWAVARGEYKVDKGGFEKEEHNFDEVKPGTKTKDELAARQKQAASKRGKERAVVESKSGAIETKRNSPVEDPVYITPKATPRSFGRLRPGVPLPSPSPQPQPGVTPGQSPVIPPMGQMPTQPQPQQPAAGQTTGNGLATSQSKYSDSEVEEAKKIFADNGIDVSGLSVRELDDYIDQFIEFDSGEEETEDNAAPTVQKNENGSESEGEGKEKEETEEEDSETIKKIKNLGFSE